jgi:hypothetical protein
MRLTITSVDYAPPELEEQLPLKLELLRQLPGDDRPDYWLGFAAKPIRWIDNNIEKTVTHIVVAARWQGTQIAPGVEDLPIGMAYVTDDSLLRDDHFELSKSRYVAIGLAHETSGGQSPSKRSNILARTIGRAFGMGGEG